MRYPLEIVYLLFLVLYKEIVGIWYTVTPLSLQYLPEQYFF